MPPTRPFLLEPHLAERVWGGSRFGQGIGEAWDLSVHPNGPSIVSSGPEPGQTLAAVVAERPDDFGGGIDLLAKRLDCAENLSVQVHPTEGDPKTEAWVVLEAARGAGVWLGFDGHPSVEQVRTAAAEGTLDEWLHFVELREGDAVLVPAGTVHAIGGGLTLFELQQSSDTTYRLYDWGRTDRELHLDEGLGCADLGPPPPRQPMLAIDASTTRLVDCEHFWIERLVPIGPVRVDPGARWVAVLTVAGGAELGDLSLTEGTTAVVPRSSGPVALIPEPGYRALVYGPSGTA